MSEFYNDEDIIKDDDRSLIGYCAYNKSEIYEGDDYIIHNGQMFHRENFLQSQIDGSGNIIDPNEE